jgi:hypothetical protein
MKIMLDNKKQYMYIINKLEMESHLTERKVIENLAFANVQVYKTQVGFNAEVSNKVVCESALLPPSGFTVATYKGAEKDCGQARIRKNYNLWVIWVS